MNAGFSRRNVVLRMADAAFCVVAALLGCALFGAALLRLTAPVVPLSVAPPAPVPATAPLRASLRVANGGLADGTNAGDVSTPRRAVRPVAPRVAKPRPRPSAIPGVRLAPVVRDSPARGRPRSAPAAPLATRLSSSGLRREMSSTGPAHRLPSTRFAHRLPSIAFAPRLPFAAFAHRPGPRPAAKSAAARRLALGVAKTSGMPGSKTVGYVRAAHASSAGNAAHPRRRRGLVPRRIVGPHHYRAALVAVPSQALDAPVELDRVPVRGRLPKPLPSVAAPPQAARSAGAAGPNAPGNDRDYAIPSLPADLYPR